MNQKKISRTIIFIILLATSCQAPKSTEREKKVTSTNNQNDIFKGVRNKVIIHKEDNILPQEIKENDALGLIVKNDVLKEIDNILNKYNVQKNIGASDINHKITQLVRKTEQSKKTINGITTTRIVVTENGKIIQITETVTDVKGNVISKKAENFSTGKEKEYNLKLEKINPEIDDKKPVAELGKTRVFNPITADNGKKNDIVSPKTGGLMQRMKPAQKEQQKKAPQQVSNLKDQLGQGRLFPPEPQKKNMIQFLTKPDAKNVPQLKVGVQTPKKSDKKPDVLAINQNNDLKKKPTFDKIETEKFGKNIPGQSFKQKDGMAGQNPLIYANENLLVNKNNPEIKEIEQQNDVPSGQIPKQQEPFLHAQKQPGLSDNVQQDIALNQDAQYVPIKIKWELGPVKEYCVKNNKMKEYQFLKNLLSAATAILRMYVFIPVTERTFVKVYPGNQCPEYYVPKPMTYDAHLVMFSRIFDGVEGTSKSVIAKSIFCTADPKTDFSRLGRIAFNSIKMINEQSGITQRNDYLATIVHETLHTLAFNSNSDDLLIKKEIKKSLKHLELIKQVNPHIYDKGHWSQEFLPTDIMGPVSVAGAVFTIYDLELMEHRSPSYLGKRAKLPYNYFFDAISSEEEFFNYKCNENEEKAKYKFFCSQIQAKNNYSGCSQDYTFITACGGEKMSNGCYPQVPVVKHNCLDTFIEPGQNQGIFEYRGLDSRCFETAGMGRGICMRYRIDNEKLKVVVGKKLYECKYDHQVVEAKYIIDEESKMLVKFVCPNIQEFISYSRKTTCPSNCNNNGFCADGKCLCYDGYDERDNCKSHLNTQSDDLLFTETASIVLQVKDQNN